MRKFSSYGPVSKNAHYYVPRQELVDRACLQLLGENPDEGGHYITVWAPRQRGKSWVMREVLWRLQKDERFDVAKVNLQVLETEHDIGGVFKYIVAQLATSLDKQIAKPATLPEFEQIFTGDVLDKPLILILDEFDALNGAAINEIARAFRNMYIRRQDQLDRPMAERDYLLHGVALIGVRAVLGVESQSGSPFNVQRSVHIPNLTFDEVQEMYHWYERESGQEVQQEVIESVFYETQGQPGLVSWLGELLTETYNEMPDQPITLQHLTRIYALALHALPNNNIVNIISKAKQEPYQNLVLELFRTQEPLPFRYDDSRMNFLYLNGVIDWQEESPGNLLVKFPSPLVQKRLFNYFAYTLFRDTGQLYPLFEDISDTITENSLNLKNLMRRYELYLKENRDWLLKDAPRRADLRVYEAIYHFNLYRYLASFLQGYGGQVWPEFPTGNGKVDLIVRYAGKLYGIEVKSFSTPYEYRRALAQAARYGKQLGLDEITLTSFVEAVDDANRARYEALYEDEETGVRVRPVLVATGKDPKGFKNL